jgi:hypothetical protein
MRRALSGGLARLLERDGYTVDTAENGQRTQQAEAAPRDWRGAIGQQTSLTIVCAWCQQTICWQRSEGAAREQISHSICLACFADVLQELDPANALPPVPTKTETAPLASYLRLVP